MPVMDLEALFHAHIQERERKLADALDATGFDALVVSSGAPHTYFADDQDAPFRAAAHFTHWCPLSGPHHVLRLEPGAKPRLFRHAPEDYWYEPPVLGEPFWLGEIDLEEAATPDGVWEKVGRPNNAAYIGNEIARAATAGLMVHPEKLMFRLDWDRAYKTDYEITCLDQASAFGARGHRAAKAAFESGASEIEIHHAFVEAVGVPDAELPYTTIVALDEKSAFLHYEAKRHVGNGKVLLIDAGGKSLGYGSDITRTHVSSACHPRFTALRDGVDALQRELCDEVRPGRPFLELHLEAHRKVASLLAESGVLRAEPDEAVASGLTGPFLPHGLGHHLGLQVHDVGGRLAGPDGGVTPPPPEHPFLRNTRTIEPRHVFTMEPGLYFIEMLLRPFRESGDERFDWGLIDELAPFGGIRVEDNLVVTEDGHRNLTRPHLPD